MPFAYEKIMLFLDISSLQIVGFFATILNPLTTIQNDYRNLVLLIMAYYLMPRMTEIWVCEFLIIP